jgi:hypothetical protein
MGIYVLMNGGMSSGYSNKKKEKGLKKKTQRNNTA